MLGKFQTFFFPFIVSLMFNVVEAGWRVRCEVTPSECCDKFLIQVFSHRHPVGGPGELY